MQRKQKLISEIGYLNPAFPQDRFSVADWERNIWIKTFVRNSCPDHELFQFS